MEVVERHADAAVHLHAVLHESARTARTLAAPQLGGVGASACDRGGGGVAGRGLASSHDFISAKRCLIPGMNERTAEQ